MKYSVPSRSIVHIPHTIVSIALYCIVCWGSYSTLTKSLHSSINLLSTSGNLLSSPLICCIYCHILQYLVRVLLTLKKVLAQQYKFAFYKWWSSTQEMCVADVDVLGRDLETDAHSIRILPAYSKSTRSPHWFESSHFLSSYL